MLQNTSSSTPALGCRAVGGRPRRALLVSRAGPHSRPAARAQAATRSAGMPAAARAAAQRLDVAPQMVQQRSQPRKPELAALRHHADGTDILLQAARTSSAPTFTPTSTPAGALTASGTCAPVTVDWSGTCDHHQHACSDGRHTDKRRVTAQRTAEDPPWVASP